MNYLNFIILIVFAFGDVKAQQQQPLDCSRVQTCLMGSMTMIQGMVARAEELKLNARQGNKNDTDAQVNSVIHLQYFSSIFLINL